MMRFFLVLLSFAGALEEEGRVVIEEAVGRTRRWVQKARTSDPVLELYFMVKHTNVDVLYETAKAVSDPRSPAYGSHLSLPEVEGLVAPRDEDVGAVLQFLEAFAPRASHGGSIVSAKVRASDAERLFDATYHELHLGDHVVHRIVEGGYSLPASVAQAVDFVAPTVHLPPAKRVVKGGEKEKIPPLASEGKDDADEEEEGEEEAPEALRVKNTPTSLRELYNVSVAGLSASNSMAVTAFLEQFYDESALEEYWDTYCDGIVCGDGLPKLVGDATTGNAGVESMLDIETVTGVAGGVEAEFWGFSGRSPDNAENEPFMKWLYLLGNTTNPPLVFSTSYGEDESSWSPAAANRLNEEFAKVATRGITLLYASGDEGANCEEGHDVFAPETPASSPWVTAVGGTTGRPETAVGLSTGGFSNYWGMPDYQVDAIRAYFAQPSYVPPLFAFNPAGRAFPDVSAQATDFCVTPFGCTVAGTSCASPTVAGIVALLNDLRLQQGKSPLGFLNYFVYQNAASFNDITQGKSYGCQDSTGKTADGWPATKGWDGVTGLGTPNYALLKDAVLQLP